MNQNQEHTSSQQQRRPLTERRRLVPVEWQGVVTPGKDRRAEDKGVPGQFVRLSGSVIARVPFPRKVVSMTAPGAGGMLERKQAVRYLFSNRWIDAKELLRLWQPWKEIDIEKLSSPLP